MNSIKNGFCGLEPLITRTWILTLSGICYLAITVLFILVMRIWDFQLIDEMYSKDAILVQIELMSSDQRYAHVLTTATLDVLYPFTYGIFQAGMAYRFLGSWGKWIAPLSLVCIPVDLIEGFSQVMLLTGSLGYVELKAIVTPIKLVLYVLGLAFALLALVIAIRQSRIQESNSC
jgi:hypothetical protein